MYVSNCCNSAVTVSPLFKFQTSSYCRLIFWFRGAFRVFCEAVSFLRKCRRFWAFCGVQFNPPFPSVGWSIAYLFDSQIGVNGTSYFDAAVPFGPQTRRENWILQYCHRERREEQQLPIQNPKYYINIIILVYLHSEKQQLQIQNPKYNINIIILLYPHYHLNERNVDKPLAEGRGRYFTVHLQCMYRGPSIKKERKKSLEKGQISNFVFVKKGQKERN